MEEEEEDEDEEGEDEEGGGGGLEGNLSWDQKSDKERISIFLKKARLCPDSFFTAIKVFKGTNMVKPKDMTEYCLYWKKNDSNL